MLEIELKYNINTDDLERIILVLRKLGSKILSDQVKISHTVYFDTPRYLLRNAGLELRVRDTAGQFTQTLKPRGQNRQALFIRDEKTASVKKMSPDTSLVQKETRLYGLRSLQQEHLHPVFETKVKRRSIEIKWYGCRLNIALDQGVIASCRRKVGSRTFNEIEIELIDGDIENLLQFGFELNKAVNIKLNGYSKADYGYALASQRHAFRPVKWEKLSEEVSAETGLKELLSIAFFQLLKNNPEQVHNRLESIHQTRVAIRRIRALLRGHKDCLNFLERKGINAELKWAQTKLGAARDWQVLKHESLPIIQPKLKRDFAKLDRYVDIQTHHHLKDAMFINNSHRYNRLLSHLFFWIENLQSDTKNEVKARNKRLKADLRNFECLSRIPARSFSKNIHDLRIRTKKLRYMLEVFQQGRDVKEVRLIKEVKSLQGLLGNFNDLSKSLELLSTATPSEIPTNVNGKLRDIVSGEMDKLYDLAKPKFKRVRAIIRQIQRSN